MTIEEIDKMPAGRELDALVAEKIFGLSVVWEDPTGFGYEPNYGPCLADFQDGDGEHPYVLRYSTDIVATMEILNKAEHYEIHKHVNDSGVDVFIAINNSFLVADEGDTIPLAVCHAALKAVMVTA